MSEAMQNTIVIDGKKEDGEILNGRNINGNDNCITEAGKTRSSPLCYLTW
jgi:hypothetical protein